MILPPPPIELFDGAALFLDFDGTLVPLEDVPDAVEVDADLHPLLARVRNTLGGRLAIVSGRSVATLRETFGLADFLLAGTHGLEIAVPGELPRAPLRMEAVTHAEEAFHIFAEDKPGLLVERKTLSVGLHFRRAPFWAGACEALAHAVALETGLFVQPGQMLYELRPGGVDKGTAVAQLMETLPMKGGIPLFVGDDVTDEHGFEAAAALGGYGILVGPPRVTAAQYNLEQVGAVRHYLTKCADRRDGQPA
jgi:trehalose 6-phosphate phosphatase